MIAGQLDKGGYAVPLDGFLRIGSEEAPMMESSHGRHIDMRGWHIDRV